MKRRATGLADIIEFTQQRFTEWATDDCPPQLWFRGQSAAAHRLVPSLYRSHIDASHEESLLVQFQHAGSLVDRELISVSSWDLLVEAQHFGIPTRLLDWSTNLFASVFFTLSKVKVDELYFGRSAMLVDLSIHELSDLASVEAAQSAIDEDHDAEPELWILDPASLHERSISSYEGPILPTGEFSAHWLTDAVATRKSPLRFKFRGRSYSNKLPVALMPLQRHARIAAQNGYFTVFGTDTTPLSELEIRNLKSIRIASNRAATIFLTLRLLGIRQSTIYPEKEKIAQDIARDWPW